MIIGDQCDENYTCYSQFGYSYQVPDEISEAIWPDCVTYLTGLDPDSKDFDYFGNFAFKISEIEVF